MLIFAQTSTDPGLADACGESNRGFVCERVFDWTGNDGLATVADWLLDRPIRIALILLVAWIVTRIAKRAIVRFTKRIAAAPSSSRLQKLREKGPGRALMDEAEQSRAEARAETLGHVLRSVVVALVWTFVSLIILGEIGVNLGPLIAGAGIGGVALGFGAQSIVKDFLSGLFMLIEDHYGVGDFIDLGYASGTVEEVSLRSTTIRDLRGTVWHVPNGEIARVGNYSQLWSKAVVDIEVAYDTDVRVAMGVMQQVANELWNDPEWGGRRTLRGADGLRHPEPGHVGRRPQVGGQDRAVDAVVRGARDPPAPQGGLRRGRHRDPVPAADHMVARRQRTCSHRPVRGRTGRLPGAPRRAARSETRRGIPRGPVVPRAYPGPPRESVSAAPVGGTARQ